MDMMEKRTTYDKKKKPSNSTNDPCQYRNSSAHGERTKIILPAGHMPRQFELSGQLDAAFS
jgi:hypothetical protein